MPTGTTTSVCGAYYGRDDDGRALFRCTLVAGHDASHAELRMSNLMTEAYYAVATWPDDSPDCWRLATLAPPGPLSPGEDGRPGEPPGSGGPAPAPASTAFIAAEGSPTVLALDLADRAIAADTRRCIGGGGHGLRRFARNLGRRRPRTAALQTGGVLNDHDEAQAATPNPNMAARFDPLQAMGERIFDAVDHLQRHALTASSHLANAERAGAALAETVQRFLADPAAVGTDALYQAYGRFMAAHAGNFATP